MKKQPCWWVEAKATGIGDAMVGVRAKSEKGARNRAIALLKEKYPGVKVRIKSIKAMRDESGQEIKA